MQCNVISVGPNHATLTCYLQDPSTAMPNTEIRPAALIFPGGGYQYCSDREAEPVALAYLAEGYNAFVLRYTVGTSCPLDKALQDAQAAICGKMRPCTVSPRIKSWRLAFQPAGIWPPRWAPKVRKSQTRLCLGTL